MTYYRIYKSGNNIEIFEYEKSPIIDPKIIEAQKEKKIRYMQLKIKYERHIRIIDKCILMEENGVPYRDVIDKLRREMYWDIKEFNQLEDFYNFRKHFKKEDSESRSQKRREQTLRDNAMGLKRMAREYFTDNAFFITLTYSDRWALGVNDIDKSDRRVKALWKKLKDNGFVVSYVGVRELQTENRDNIIHYHYLVECDELNELYQSYGAKITRKKKNEEHKLFERDFMASYWKFGYVDIRQVQGTIDDTGAYLAKYMTKNHIKHMEWLEKRRLVLRSKNIKKIEPLDIGSDSKEIDEIINNLDLYKIIAYQDIENKLIRKRVFTNGYDSEYLGKVVYYEIHNNRIK